MADSEGLLRENVKNFNKDRRQRREPEFNAYDIEKERSRIKSVCGYAIEKYESGHMQEHPAVATGAYLLTLHDLLWKIGKDFKPLVRRLTFTSAIYNRLLSMTNKHTHHFNQNIFQSQSHTPIVQQSSTPALVHSVQRATGSNAARPTRTIPLDVEDIDISRNFARLPASPAERRTDAAPTHIHLAQKGEPVSCMSGRVSRSQAQAPFPPLPPAQTPSARSFKLIPRQQRSPERGECG
jgi:hypothetical protein